MCRNQFQYHSQKSSMLGKCNNLIIHQLWEHIWKNATTLLKLMIDLLAALLIMDFDSTHPHCEFGAVIPPRAPNFTPYRLVDSFGVVNPNTKLRSEDDSFETTFTIIRVNSRHRLEHPSSNRTKSVMVERVHRRCLESFFSGPSIPSFPHSCSVVEDGVKPGGVGFLEEQPVGYITMVIGC